MAILQNHLIYNLPAKDASPSPKILMGAEEFFIDHQTTTTMAIHGSSQIFFLFAQTGGLWIWLLLSNSLVESKPLSLSPETFGKSVRRVQIPVRPPIIFRRQSFLDTPSLSLVHSG
jgi:hypothetical protein